jgi:SAM-dependent methyltransferase
VIQTRSDETGNFSDETRPPRREPYPKLPRPARAKTPMTEPSPPDIPRFPKHDPSEAAFWDARFDASFTPWDQGAVPADFRTWVVAQVEPKKVLIPGCGAAREVTLLASRDWDVTAIDFSPSAVAAAKTLLGSLAPHVREQDFFDPDLVKEQFSIVYERAFLCALPPRMRTQWAAQMRAILANTQGAIVGYFFIDEQNTETNPKGPPFIITRNDLNALMASAGCTLVDEKTPTDTIDVFRGRERWMVWASSTT